MTVKLYLTEATLSLSTMITYVDRGERPFLRLRETLFHPQGGGQRGDRGRIGYGRILDTRHAGDGEVDHFVDSAFEHFEGQRVEITVDADHRHRGGRLHSAGHLIADAVQSLRPGLKAVAGHHWDGEARVEFEGDIVSELDLADALEAELRNLVGAALPIAVIGDPFTTRTIQIGSFAAVPCGGTHLSNTSEIGAIRLNGIRVKRGRLRVSYVVEELGVQTKRGHS